MKDSLGLMWTLLHKFQEGRLPTPKGVLKHATDFHPDKAQGVCQAEKRTAYRINWIATRVVCLHKGFMPHRVVRQHSNSSGQRKS